MAFSMAAASSGVTEDDEEDSIINILLYNRFLFYLEAARWEDGLYPVRSQTAASPNFLSIQSTFGC